MLANLTKPTIKSYLHGRHNESRRRDSLVGQALLLHQSSLSQATLSLLPRSRNSDFPYGRWNVRFFIVAFVVGRIRGRRSGGRGRGSVCSGNRLWRVGVDKSSDHDRFTCQLGVRIIQAGTSADSPSPISSAKIPPLHDLEALGNSRESSPGNTAGEQNVRRMMNQKEGHTGTGVVIKSFVLFTLLVGRMGKAVPVGNPVIHYFGKLAPGTTHSSHKGCIDRDSRASPSPAPSIVDIHFRACF